MNRFYHKQLRILTGGILALSIPFCGTVGGLGGTSKSGDVRV